METAEKKQTEISQNDDFERKRGLITFQVSAIEKRKITEMAVRDCGISVSEFIRTKIFVEPKKVEPVEALEPIEMDDEERKIYEDKLKDLTSENRTLKDELVKIKVLKTEIAPSDDSEQVTPTNDVNVLVIKLEPEFKQLFDTIKSNRDEKYKTLDLEEQEQFYDFNKFLKMMFLRGVKRSYYNDDLKNSTGLILSDFTKVAEIAGIENFNI